MAQVSHSHTPMYYTLMIVSIVALVCGYLFGRKYTVVKRDLVTVDTPDIVNDVKQALSKPNARVISPRQLAQERQFNKDLSEDL